MNSDGESDVKSSRSKYSIERDRAGAKRMIEYLYFYGSVIVILSAVSFILDLICHRISYGEFSSIRYGPQQYIFFYTIYSFWMLPGFLLYNYLVNYLQPTPFIWRTIACVIVILICFFIIRSNFEFGEYIGEYRQSKNFLVALLSGFCIELLRDWIVSNRVRNGLNQ